MMLKITLTFLAYHNVATPALAVLYPWITVSVLLVGLLIPVAFLPHRLYMVMARPVEFVDKVRALRKLQTLKARLDQFCPPVIDDAVGWRAMLDNLDFYLYRAVVAILDAKQTLSGYARITDGLAISPLEVTDRCGQTPAAWDAHVVEQAQLLNEDLQTVDDRAEFVTLVQAYHQVGRTVRRQWVVPVEAVR